jgi:two-component sensor histidine kinase
LLSIFFLLAFSRQELCSPEGHLSMQLRLARRSLTFLPVPLHRLHLGASISGASPVAITADADELYIHSEHAVPIAIIINELVTNGLKYGFPEGRAGRIQVTLRAGDEVVVSVADNGVGLREPPRAGVGSRVVSLLVEQLGGTITHQNLDPGYRVILRMPRPAV